MSHPMPFNLAHALAAIDSRTKHRPQIPSRRNQEIFRRVEALRERQQDIAAELKLTPSRVSQIVSQVRRWLAGGSPGHREQLADLERQRLERTLAAARHQAVLDIALDEVHRQRKTARHTTVRTETEGGQETKQVTTVRDQPLNVQLLKTAQRSIDQIHHLSNLDPLPDPPPAEVHDDELFGTIYKLLVGWRQRAEDEGHVAKSECTQSLVEYFLAALLGREHDFGAEGFEPVSPAVRELVANFVSGCCSLDAVLPDVPSAPTSCQTAPANSPTPPLKNSQPPSPPATSNADASTATTPNPPTPSTAYPPPQPAPAPTKNPRALVPPPAPITVLPPWPLTGSLGMP
jgi:hypothetical protein